MTDAPTFDQQWQSAIEDMLTADAELEHQQQIDVGLDEDDDSWLPDWVLKHLLALDAQEQAAKTQYDRRMAECRRIREYLRQTYAQRLRDVVRRQMDSQPGNKKRVDYALGCAGFRTIPASTKIEIDEDEALPDVLDRCPDAVKMTIRKSDLKPLLDQGETIPGVRIIETPARERFFVGNESFDDDEPQTQGHRQ